jgi:hypothetical protein
LGSFSDADEKGIGAGPVNYKSSHKKQIRIFVQRWQERRKLRIYLQKLPLPIIRNRSKRSQNKKGIFIGMFKDIEPLVVAPEQVADHFKLKMGMFQHHKLNINRISRDSETKVNNGLKL